MQYSAEIKTKLSFSRRRARAARRNNRSRNRNISFASIWKPYLKQFAILAAASLLLYGWSLSPAHAQKTGAIPPAKATRFELKNGNFELNGKPFVIISGEMHYERTPHQYWRHRLRMAKAMGLNTIATYVFWNVHEPEKGKWDFAGDADLVKFIKTAQEEGLYILLRPGPYACAEWEFGGYPYWLLNEKTDGKPLLIRSTDPNYLKYAGLYMDQVGKRCVPLQYSNGGNILMVQVENEYGSFGKDKVYMAAVRDSIRSAGFTVPLYTADGPGQTPNGMIDGVLPCLDGSGSTNLAATIDKYHPGGPYFASETYPGWLDHWGEPFNRHNPEREAKALAGFVSKNYSVNLYMIHGGTNFGFMNGANFGAAYQPSITSYDYGAPLDEAGRPTPMYTAMRNTLSGLLPAGSIPDVPANNPIIALPRFTLTQSGSLLGVLPKPVKSDSLLTMEDLHQAYGYILYRTTVKGPFKGPLTIKGLRDFAVVLVNGKEIGTLDRRRKQQAISLEIPAEGAVLDLLVENSGRINYGGQMRENRKGITGSVLLGSEPLSNWNIYSLPLLKPGSLPLDGKKGDGPTLYKGSFSLDTVGDTFLDMRGWTKGAVWINGHNLGRYWYIGPQQTLYVPGPWLRKGTNDIVVFEQVATKNPSVKGLTEPILDVLVPEPKIVEPEGAAAPIRPTLAVPPVPKTENRIAQGEFTDGTSLQAVHFSSKKARYIAFQSTSAFDGSDFASCAEFDLLGPGDKPLNRAKWRIVYTDSEEDFAEDNRAENMIDGDESTFWHSLWGKPYTKHPHFVVIDLGSEQEFSGFRYEPRQSGEPGRIKGYQFYASNTPFGATVAASTNP
jgi:beta-galactosidase